MGRWHVALALVLTAPIIAGSARAEAAGAASADDPASGAIRMYQHYLSSLRHMHCRFAPSCSEYAIQAIATYGLVEGSARAADRLMRCNASASGFYPRGADGRLVDPVDATLQVSFADARVPRWLLPAAEGPAPPAAVVLPPERRARLGEAVEFALRLQMRGDCEGAAGEYQRAGMLADTAVADVWAFARIAECHFASSQWSLAERAYLTSAMLSVDAAPRATAVFGAAASRFNAGAYVACGRLLADSVLLPQAADGAGNAPAALPPVVPRDAPSLPGERVATLAGLCALAGGAWSDAGADFHRAASITRNDEAREHILRLVPYAAAGPRLPHRSAGVAGALSATLPGSGQAYCGRARDGVRHLLFNAVLVVTVGSLARDGHLPAALAVSSVAVPFYVGNVLGAQSAARQFNRRQRMDLLARAIAASEH